MPRALALMFVLLAPLAAAAQDAPEGPEKLRLLVMDLKVTGVDAETAALVGELISVKLSDYERMEVFSGADVKRMVELEADKAAAGCDEDSSCLADLAGALGARYVIYGRMGKLGSRIIVTLNLFDAEQAKAIERADIKAADMDELGDRLNDTVAGLVSPLVGSAPKAEPPPPEVREPPPPAKDLRGQKGSHSAGALPIILISAGIIAGLAGGIFDLTSSSSYNDELDGGDFIGPVAYLAAAGLIWGGVAAGGE